MLLAFWMNLYFIFFLFYFVISTLLDFNISNLLIFCFSLIPLYLIGKKKKFEIPFFKMYLYFNFILYLFTALIITLYFYSDDLKQQSATPNAHPVNFFLFLCIPLLITLFLITTKHFLNTDKNTSHTIINIISILNSFFSIFWMLAVSTFSFLCVGFMASANSEYPPIEDYSKKVIELSTPETYRTKHFPPSLPTNIKNYSFKIDHEPRGWCIDTLSFTTDKAYIKKLLNSQKDKIIKKINFSEIEKHYNHLHHNLEIENNVKNTYTVYILKNENNDEEYTSGFVISEELQQVIFFYANYNLKKIQ